MSRWPCRHTIGRFSRPFDAGFRTTTVPAASWTHSSPSFPAVPTTYAATAASCFEGRGIFEISAKYFHNPAGFSPSIAFGI